MLSANTTGGINLYPKLLTADLAGDFNLVDGRYGFADRFPVDIHSRSETIGIESANVIHTSDHECTSNHCAVVADLVFARGRNGNTDRHGSN